MVVGIAYQAFFHSFKSFYPNLELINKDKPLDKYELIIFSGGSDINPKIYGQKNSHSYFSPQRDIVELAILQEAIEKEIKILGVCRGHQLINAYLGGKLTQDILLEKPHKDHSSYHILESKKQDSIINKFFNRVNSLHHQGVLEAGKGLEITSTYKGVIESTESDNIISVQWHPEFLRTFEFFSYLEEWIK